MLSSVLRLSVLGVSVHYGPVSLDARLTSVRNACGASEMAVAEGLSDDKHECKTRLCLFEHLSNALADETP